MECGKNAINEISWRREENAASSHSVGKIVNFRFN